MDILRHAADRFRFLPAVISPESVISYGQLDRYVQATSENLRITNASPTVLCAPVTWEYVVLLFALWRKKVITCSINPKIPAAGITHVLKCIGTKNFIAAKEVPALISQQKPCPISRKCISFDQNLTLTLTSGSSGTPKAVLHTFANHYFSAKGSNANIPFGPGDRWLLSLPLHHVSGLSILFRALIGGGSIVIPASKDIASEIQRWGISHVSLVPVQLQALCSQSKSSQILKAVLVGGEPISPQLIAKARQRALPIFLSYGLTEMASQVATTNGKNLNARLLPYRKLKISPASEILVGGKVLFKGYWKKGSLQRPQIWFPTGDLGRLEIGSVHVLGRRDNMFISGGENIHPEEIERCLLLLSDVKQAVVVAVKDKKFGKRPAAFINTTAPVRRIKAHLQKNLPRFKIPVVFYPWPKNIPPQMKLDRRFFAKLSK